MLHIFSYSPYRVGLLVGLCLWVATTWAIPFTNEQATSLAETPAQLGEGIWYLEDPTGQLSASEVLAMPAERWQQSRNSTPSFAYTNSAYWFALRLHNPDSRATEQILEVAYPVLDRIELFRSKPVGNAYKLYQTGDTLPFDQRPLAHRNFLFPLAFEGYETHDLLMRVQTSSALQIPLRLWNERSFWIADQTKLSFEMLYYGLLLALMLYNFFIFLSIRSESYLLYSLFVGSFTLFQVCLHGFGLQFLWPDSPHFNERIMMLSLSASIALGSIFACNLLELRSSHSIFYGWLLAIALLSTVNVILTPFITYQASIIAALGLSIAACLGGTISGFVRWFEGFKLAQFYTIAWIAFILGTLLFALNKMGVVPRTLITENAMSVGVALQLILLSLALANRIHLAHQEKDSAQAQALSYLQRYRMLYENAIEGLFQLDPKLYAITANRALLKLFGFHSKAQITMCDSSFLLDYIATEEDRAYLSEELQSKGRLEDFECLCRRPDGSEFWASWTILAMYDEAHELSHYEGSVVDTSARREKDRMEQEKRAAIAASEAKSRFLATMSHEIRTPMHGIQGMLELLLGTRLEEKQRHYAVTARNSCQHLLQIINDILDLSKIEANRLQLENIDFELREQINSCMQLFAESARRKDLMLQSKVSDTCPRWVAGDPLRLRQILSNLLSNAIKFTLQGSIELTVKPTNEADPYLLRFTISDTGTGIDPAQQARIFDAFSQADESTARQFGGTGLGLTICHELVQQMGGQMGVDSAPGQGSQFWFDLPLNHAISSPVQEETESRHSDSPALPSATRLLLIEDNPTNQLVAKAMLERMQLTVDIVDNGPDALRAWRQRHYDILLVDIQLPGMDGYTIAEEIRRLESIGGQHTRLIALTANASADDRERCLSAGMDDFLAKPFTFEALQQTLAAHLQATAGAYGIHAVFGIK